MISDTQLIFAKLLKLERYTRHSFYLLMMADKYADNPHIIIVDVK